LITALSQVPHFQGSRAVPTKAEEYRARAKEYERVANLLSFEPAKSVVLEMARKCRAMAEQTERDGS
jgi:hypothetical protein